MDVLWLHAGILERTPARRQRAFEEIHSELLKPRTGELQKKMLGTRRVGRDERKIDLRLPC